MARARAVKPYQAKSWPPTRLEFARMERQAWREMRTCPEEITFASWPPDWAELPESDGLPMDSTRHAAQMQLLVEPLRWHWSGRATGVVFGNLGIWFRRPGTPTAVNLGPDVFVVRDAVKGEREKWVVELEGRGPDVVIELLSPRTARRDRTTKKALYQDILKVPEYYMYHPYRLTREAFRLRDGVYVPVPLDAEGRHYSEQLGLYLVPWQGVWEELGGTWFRWALPDGTLLPTAPERAEAERQRAEAAERTLQEERETRRRLEQRIAELETRGHGGNGTTPL